MTKDDLLSDAGGKDNDSVTNYSEADRARDDSSDTEEEEDEQPAEEKPRRGRGGGRKKGTGKQVKVTTTAATAASTASESKRKAALKEQDKVSYDLDSPKVRKDTLCANCLNSLENRKLFKHEPEGIKVPKNEEGNYIYKSPGTAEGKFLSALCEDCEAKYARGQPVDFRHVTVIVKDTGSVRNIPLAEVQNL